MLRAVIEKSEIDDISIHSRHCFRGSLLNDLLTMRCFTQRASFICTLADSSHASQTKYKQKYPLSFCYSPLHNLIKFPCWLLLCHPRQPQTPPSCVPRLHSSTWKLLPEQMVRNTRSNVGKHLSNKDMHAQIVTGSRFRL